MAAPIITADGRVLYAPPPARLADEVHPGLWMGGSWARYTEAFDAEYDRRRTEDGPTLPTDLGRVVAQVVADVEARRKVLVRCAMGLNRSGLVVAVALSHLTGVSGMDVLAHLRRVRSPHVCCNPKFAEYVRAMW
ncbi:hypothetical protein OHB24_27145 [Kribbella sp. NBC_00482]|uniref:hypothetical protein n=1 Tax=Kribbella sp. NBC_00482 TaxID=2975968 RepID=UPI002E17B040